MTGDGSLPEELFNAQKFISLALIAGMSIQEAQLSTPGEILEVWYWNRYFNGNLPKEEASDV